MCVEIAVTVRVIERGVNFLLVNTVINARVWIHTLITINPQITLITYDHISSKAGPALINLQ
jgi:hypothetical protein